MIPVPLKVATVVLGAIVLQISFIARLPIADARADVVLLVAIAAGLESDAERGAIVGFAAGLAFDLMLNTPVGLSALTYCLIGYLVGSMQGSMLRTAWWIPVLTTMVASAAGVLLFAVLDQVVGQATVEPGRLPTIVVVVAVVNGALSRPFRWVLRWALADAAGSRDRMMRR